MAIGVRAYNIYGEIIDFTTYNNVRFLGSVITNFNGNDGFSSFQQSDKTVSKSFSIKNFDPTTQEVRYALAPKSDVLRTATRGASVIHTGGDAQQAGVEFRVPFELADGVVITNGTNEATAVITGQSVQANFTAINSKLTEWCTANAGGNTITFCRQVNSSSNFLYEEAIVYFYLTEK